MVAYFLARTSACSSDNTGMGLYFEEVDRRWWLADCFSNGLKDISLDVVVMEIRV